VEQLFERFEDASEREKKQIAQQVCAMLTVHAQIEEELVYPAAKQALEEDDRELVDEANVEHASAKDLIAQIERGESDELFDAKVKVLGEYIKHHVKEEEGELFPKLKQTDLDLNALGARLASRKAELAGESGMAMENSGDEDESDLESNLNPARTGGSRGNRPSASRNP
jgi:hemerythrin-like domain-containing protein